MQFYYGYRVFLPYCLERLSDGRYIVLNADFKPLGVPSFEDVDLETHPSAHTINITPELARKLSVSGSDALDCIYLHEGKELGPPEEGERLAAYAARLAVFMRLKIEVQLPYRIPPLSAPR
ncbi:MAG: hypothetical protein Q7J47_03235 [Azoarcus sp.]|nr:hypothetical protein [Azoarcus sp.]